MGAFVTITHLQHATTKGESIMKKITVCLIIALLSGVLSACQAAAPSDSASPRQTTSPPAQDASTQPVTTTAVFDPVITPSTNPSTKPAPSPLTMIYEVGSTYSSADGIKRVNVISDQAETTVDQSILQEREIKIGGISLNLRYERTLKYPFCNEPVYQYLVEGVDGANGLILKQDGTVYSLLYKFTTLDISSTEQPEKILPLLKAELSRWTDITLYAHVDLPIAREDKDGFGIYDFIFYNQIDGYMTDYTMVAVNDKGEVYACKIRNLPVKITSLDIDKEKENNLLNLKLKDMYSEYNGWTYKGNSQTIKWMPQIRIYNEKLYVEYAVSGQLTSLTGEGEASTWVHTLLIPLDLLTTEVVLP